MATYGVGQSKVRMFRQCRRAYFHKYHEELIRKRTRRPFLFGKIVHRMLEEHADDEDPFTVIEGLREDVDAQKLFAAEKEMYGDILADIAIIMTDYFDYHRDGLRLLPVMGQGELRYAEHEFAIPLEQLVKKKWRRAVDGIVFKGQVDGLGKTPNGLRWLVETKTFDKLPDADERWRNLQTVVYRRAALLMGWVKTLDGVCWNYIMSKPPRVPQLLKSGKSLSLKKKIVTLPSVVEATLKVHGLKRAGHEKLFEVAESCRDRYFQRIFTPVNETVADKIFDGFVETAIEMRDNAGRSKGQNIGRHCGWCDYEPICRAELTGGDVDYVKSIEYVREDPEAYRRAKRSDKLKVIG